MTGKSSPLTWYVFNASLAEVPLTIERRTNNEYNNELSKISNRITEVEASLDIIGMPCICDEDGNIKMSFVNWVEVWKKYEEQKYQIAEN